MSTLNQLAEILEQRKGANPESSYVAQLYNKGLDKILKKIGEEASEVIIAGKNQNKDEIVYEMADLWFHCMILLANQNIHPDEILAELARRQGISGLIEKANRPAE